MPTACAFGSRAWSSRARQPSTARGFRFFTLADEDAHCDLVFRPAVVQRTLEVSRHPLLMVDGRLQVEHGRVNVLVEQVTALTPDGDPIAHPAPHATGRLPRFARLSLTRVPIPPLRFSVA